MERPRSIQGLRKVLVCGLVAVEGEPARGGFQSANLRLMAMLRGLGVEVGALRYPQIDGGVLAKSAAYLLSFMRIGVAILLGDAHGAAIHFTPLAGKFVVLECALIALARLRGYRIVVDWRAGGRESNYRVADPITRAATRWAIGMAHAVAYEGRASLSFLAALAPQKPRFWLPNFILATELRRRETFAADGPNLIYVGLVSEAKGALAAIALARRLRSILPGTRLTFVGRRDEAFAAALERACDGSTWIEHTGALPPDRMQPLLDRSHFFVFLSLWEGEGHSNALTEAMARGCVPVVTRHGFLADVVGDSGFVLEDRARPEAAVDWMVARWSAAEWMAASTDAVDRVAGNFTDLRVQETLCAIYCAAFA